MNKRSRIIFGSIIAAVLLIPIGYLVFVLATLSNKRVSVCSAQLPVAASNLQAVNATKLKPTVEEIKKLKGFEKDQDCLNIVVTYYVNIGDPKNARLYMDKLNGIYNAKRGFSLALGSRAYDIDRLRSAVTGIENIANQAQNNGFYTKATAK